MTIHLPLSLDVEARLRQRAAASGQDITSFVLEAVEEKLQAPPSFRDVFTPLHEAFQEDTMTDEQLDALFEQGRNEVWQRRQVPKAS